METVYREGYVYIQNRFAGMIKETEEGYNFTYAESYLESENPVSLSLNMPITQKEYNSTILFPFFDGLIPEGWLLRVVSRNWRLDEKDRFGLLLAVCKDCIGDGTGVLLAQKLYKKIFWNKSNANDSGYEQPDGISCRINGK